MPYSLPVRCTGWSSTETTRSSRFTTSLPVRIVDSLVSGLCIGALAASFITVLPQSLNLSRRRARGPRIGDLDPHQKRLCRTRSYQSAPHAGVTAVGRLGLGTTGCPYLRARPTVPISRYGCLT